MYNVYLFFILLVPSEDLESFSHNLYLLGVGRELIPTLTEKEQEYWKLLTPAEQEMEGHCLSLL